MTTHVKVGTTWREVTAIHIRRADETFLVKEAFVRREGAWRLIYNSVVEVEVTTSATNLNVQSLFSAEDWASPNKLKIVNIRSGVVLGSTTSSAALLTGTGRGGLLEINNAGSIQGAGGAAGTGGAGGAGGPAINVQQTGATIRNSGVIAGGGGGGGQGGTGYVDVPVVNREPASGELFNRWEPFTWLQTQAGATNSIAYWQGTLVKPGGPPSDLSSFVHGGYTYYKGTHRDSAAGSPLWGLYRTHTTYRRDWYAGGAGGRGQGYNQSRAGGTAGSGNSGAGGTGGTWGVAGGAGSAGNSTGGNAGGAAGAAITGSARTVVNTGTILGAH